MASEISIVVRCTKSRNFPSAGPNRGYWLEAVLDDGARATSAVFGSAKPEWAGEDALAWTVPKARLQAIKAASPLGKLRLDCLAGERHHNKIRTASRMVIGSVFLDVLSARPKKETRWYPLLNCRLPTSPDLCIEFERRAGGLPRPGPAGEEAAAPATAPADAAAGDMEEMVTIVGNGEDEFVLSVAPATGAAAPPVLSFVWLGREVALRPSAQLQLRSSMAELRAFFGSLVPQQLLMQQSSRDQPTTAAVNLQSMAPLLTDGATEASLDVQIAQPGGAPGFALTATLRRSDAASASAAPPPSAPASSEVLALALRVCSVESAAAEVGSAPAEFVLSVFCPGQQRLRFTPPFKLSGDQTAVKVDEDLRFELPGLQPTDVMPWLAQNHLQIEVLLTSPGADAGFKTVGRGNWDATGLLTQDELEKTGTVDIMALSDDGATTTGRWGSVAVELRWEFVKWEGEVPGSMALPAAGAYSVEAPDEPAHVFNIGVDLRSIADVKETSGQLFLKYSYPQVFGTSKPFHTHTVDPRRAETLLPHSYALHEMTARRTALLSGLRSQPLVVELWRRGEYENDVCLGLAAVPMGALADAPATTSAASAPSSVAATTQKVESVVEIVSPSGNGTSVGKLRIALTMDDFGALASQQQSSGGQPTARTPVAEEHHDDSDDASQGGGGDAEPGGMEYEVAWQLEMWKRNEEARWQAELRKREAQRMDALESAWRAKEIEREGAVNKAVAAHRQAESKLNQLLFDCEQRDQALQLRESRLEKEKEDAQREAERKITEMEDTCRRVREEYVHQCALENARLQDISTENARMRERLVRSNCHVNVFAPAFDTDRCCCSLQSESEEAFRNLEADFTQYKHVMRGTPEHELRDQVKVLTLRARELDERLRGAENEKKQYKEQLLRSLQEIAKMKHAREIEADKQLRSEQLKVEQLKMQILTQEERKNLASERSALGDIKRELSEVQRLEMQRGAQQAARYPPSMQPGRTAPVTTMQVGPTPNAADAAGSAER